MTTSGLNVIIIGAGLGGLSTAAALRQNGHYVEIFEASRFQEEIGAGIGLPPNAVKILKHLSCNFGQLGGVPYEGVVTFLQDGKAGLPQTLDKIQERFGEAWYLCHRVDLHAALKSLAFSCESAAEGHGPPVRLHLGRKVVDCNPTLGTITLDGGDIKTADLIIAADGIHSTCRTALFGETARPPPSGIAAYRWMIDTTTVNQHPELDWVMSGPSGPRIVTGSDSRVLFIYPCRGGSLVNVLAIHQDSRNQDDFNWNQPATQAEVTRLFADFHPKFKLLLSFAKDIRLWQMRCVPVLDSWVKGNIALVGDSAHATLPTFGQGFAMALEDAITLGTLLPTGIQPHVVPARLGVYQTLRKKRAEFVAMQSRDQMLIPEMRGLFYRSPEMQHEIMAYEARQIAESSLIQPSI